MPCENVNSLYLSSLEPSTPKPAVLKEVSAPRAAPVPTASPPPRQSLSPSEEPKHLSESFTKTVQEWERVKVTRAKSTTSPPSPDPPSSPPTSKANVTHPAPTTTSRPFEPPPPRKSRHNERSKSRDRDRDKSRHRYEKERQRLEKKEKKIEQERQKLEQLKMKLDMSDSGLTAEFQRKLDEWQQQQQRLEPEESPKRSRSHKQHRESVPCSLERIKSDPIAQRMRHRASLPPDTIGKLVLPSDSEHGTDVVFR